MKTAMTQLAKWLELEVTEGGEIMSNPEESIKTLNQLNEIGVELAIDDFGTGYSSLAYLRTITEGTGSSTLFILTTL